MRFLLIRFSSLGDILLQTSFASWLKMNYPGCHISLLTLKGNEALVENHPHIDEVISYQKQKGTSDFKNIFRFCRNDLKSKDFDLIIDLHGTTRAFLTKLFLPELPALSMDKRRLERFLLVKSKINLLKNQSSIHDRNLKDLAWAFNEQFDANELQQFVNESFGAGESLISSSVSTLKVKSSNRVIIAPGASFNPKRWPVKNFFKVAQSLLENSKCDIAVIGGPGEDYCSIFNELVEIYPQRVQNLQGKLSLKDSMKEVANSCLVIGNDSLIGHIAESCAIPSFVIYGPTIESFGFAPHLEKSKTFSVEKLWCRPCSTTGKSPCFRKSQYCMDMIKPEQITKEVLSLLGGGHAI